MSTIIISPLGEVTEDSSEVIQLLFVVEDDDFVGLFDVLEVWRSASGESGPYEELTAAVLSTARIPKDGVDEPSIPVTGPSVNIVGRTLDLLVGEEIEVPVTFAGVDPLTFADVASQITAQGLNLVESYVTEYGEIVIQTFEAGLTAILRVRPGSEEDLTDAAVLLGLPTTEPSSLAYGRTSRILLVVGQGNYELTDPYGNRDYFYKSRFRNSTTGAVSEFSIAYGVGQFLGVSQSATAVGTVLLIDASGNPVRREIRVHPTFDNVLVEGRLMAGSDLVRSTDGDGKVEFKLLRGKRYTVAIMGTDIARDIVVPIDSMVTTFNLLDPSITTGEDIFKVQVPDLVTAERRSL